MDPASSIAGLIGLAGLAAQTTIQLRWLCQSYATATEDVERISSSLQTLQDLLEEATRLLRNPSIISATTMITRSRMNTLLYQCQKDLELWTSRIAHHLPKSAATKLGQRWKKIIVAVDKPKLADLTLRVSQYVEQIDALLGVMRGDLGVATNVAVVASVWAQGIFHFKVKKKLEEIAHGVQNLQTSQDSFKGGTFGRLDAIGSAVGSIEVTLHDLLQQSSTTAKPTFKPSPEFGRTLLPYVRNREFVGRKAIVENIEHKLELPSSRCAIYGLGGVGKSQVALEVAYRIQTLSPEISCYWVSAVSRTTFTQSYRDIASALQIPGSDDPSKDTLDLVKTWLRGDFSSKWLLIVDNVDDMKSLKGEGVETNDGAESEFNLLKYLPQCAHGKLLFTTRSKTAALRLTGNGPIVHIPSMDASEAQELLRVRLKDEFSATTSQDCLDLVKALEYLPLAVSHAASYIREMDITPARYLRMFNDGDKKRTKLLTHTYEDLARDDGQSNTVLTTWRISFEQIERDWPESASLLKLMGTLHWQDIPQYLLQQGDLEDDDDFQDAMSPLIAFSLVQKSPDSKTFSMHRLIHIAIKSWDENLEFEYVAERFLIQVFPLLDINRVSVGQRQRCRQLLPHAQAIIDALAKQDEYSLPSVQLRFRISLYMSVLGQYRRSRELGERLIGPVRELSDRGQSDVSPSVLEDHITRMFLSEGNDKVALDRAQKTLDLRKAVLPPDNPDLIRAKDLVAMSLMAQGKSQEAETQLREAHEALEKARGKRDLATILVLLNLAVAYSEQQRWKLCTEAYQAALDVLLPMYGDHNDCVIRCMEGLAEAERCLYRTQEGGELIRKAVALAEEINGPDHPYTLRAISRLGCQYFDEGNPVAGFEAFERVWKGYQRLYGDNSKLTLFALRLVAINHRDRREGERLIRIALEHAFELWGHSAAKTRIIENNLVQVQTWSGNQKKQKEAEEFCRKLYEDRKAELGHDNKWTLQAQTLLGRVLCATFRLDEGLSLINDAAERQMKLLGENHADLYESEDALILNYGSRDSDHPSKVALLRKHIQYLGQQRGSQSRGVLYLKSDLGCSLWVFNKDLPSAAAKKLAQEGGSLMIEAYETLLKLYGDADVTIVEAAEPLARYYDQINESTKAEPLHRKTLAAYRQRFGEEAPETLFEESKLANCLLTQYRGNETLEVIDRIFPIQKRQARSEPDDLPLIINLVVSGMVKSAALWLLAQKDVALETLRTEIKRLRELPEISQEAENIQKIDKILHSIDNSIRDDILEDETRLWITASGRPSDFKELEVFFPAKRHTEIPAMNVRRVKSWYLASAEHRPYKAKSADDRAADFARLRGEPELESTPPAGWSCSRCETPIPPTDFFYRCYEPSCKGGKYEVCESCHNSGLTCLKFEHVPHRVKAYRVCNCCKKDITGRYVWTCEICDDGDYVVCKPCHGSGRRCEDSSHHMIKQLEACFADYPWYAQLHCDSCGNVIEDGEGYEHCKICNENDYDICGACVPLGIKCKDGTHKLEKLVYREI